MACESCGDKPKKCNKDFTKAVIEIDNPEQITLMRKVTIPASMGDDTTVPPVVGKYKNVLLYYEANQKSYLYSSDGIPTQLVNGVTDYEAAINLPQINSHTLIGDKTGDQLGLQDKLTAGDNITIENNVISATDTTYGPATDAEIGLVKPGDGLEVDANGTMSISDIEQYAHFFDTVADMKASTDLVNGDYAQTLGYYAVGDGGGALYKIRTKTESDVIDETSIYAMTSDNTLVAELIMDSAISVKQFGVKSDGTTDNYSKLTTIIGLGVKKLYFPNGTYVINTPININTCPMIVGESVKNTIINAPAGFLEWTNNPGFMSIKGFTINGSSVNSNTAINGKLFKSTIENVQILNYADAIIIGSGSYINTFYHLIIEDCTRGVTSSSNFNENNFRDCVFSRCTEYGVSTPGQNVIYQNCNFNTNHYGFYRTTNLNVRISNCYCEGNDCLYYVDNASYSSKVIIENCRIYTKATSPDNGSVAILYTPNSPDNQTASLLVNNCCIITHGEKAFAFTENSGHNATYWAVSLRENSYYNGSATMNNPTYISLFDTTNCTNYCTRTNPSTLDSDLPISVYNSNLYLFKHALGNLSASLRSNTYYILQGYITHSSTGATTIDFSDIDAYFKQYPGVDSLPVLIRYTDNTVEPGFLAIDAGSLSVKNVNSAKTTKTIIINNVRFKAGQ